MYHVNLKEEAAAAEEDYVVTQGNHPRFPDTNFGENDVISDFNKT